MTKLSSSCPIKSVLQDFHLGNLAEDLQNSIATHLEHCTDCESYLLEIDRLADDAIAALRSPEIVEIESDCPSLIAGLRIGDYEVIEEIGRGGMGLVCKARHVPLQRIVALKMLIAGELTNAECRSRFSAEAEATARLRHPNIVQIYEVGTWDRDNRTTLPFLALEYVSGGSLSQRTQGRPQPTAMAALWIETLARAVQHAHDHGVVHRDLKPSNVLFDSDGQLKLCDFGVAKFIAGSDVHTRTGVLIGTPEYMAPEQAGEGQPVGAAADVWALGAILYTLLTGRPPFIDSDALTVLQKVRFDDPVPPRLLQRAVERDLETVCMKCLHKDIGRRYASAATLADDLARFRDGLPILARPISSLEQSWKWFKRRPTAAATLLWFIFLATIGLPTVTWLWLRSETARLRADNNLEHAESTLYFNQIAMARQGLESEGIAQTLSMLDRCRPKQASIDRRNWEWRYLNRQAKFGHRDGLIHEQVEDSWTWINDVAWSPDGKKLASVGGPVTGTNPGKIRIWDTEGWRSITEWDQPGGTIFATAWHPTQPFLVTGGTDGSVYQWYSEGNAPSRVLWQSSIKDLSVRHLQFSPDGKYLAIGSTHGLFLYDLDAQCERLAETAEWPGVACLDFRSEVRSSDESSLFLLGGFSGKSNDSQFGVWDVSSAASIKKMPSKIQFGPLSRGALSKGDPALPIAIVKVGKSDVELWNHDGSKLLDRLRGHRGGIADVKFASNGNIATAGDDGTVRLWNTLTSDEKMVFRGHSDGVRKINFSPDGTKIASCGRDLRICIWELNQDPQGIHFQGTYAGGGEFAGGLAFSKDTNAVAVVSQASQTVLFHDAATGKNLSNHKLPLIESHGQARRDQVLRSDATQLVTSDPHHPEILRIWDVEQGTLLASLVHESKPTCIAWSDDGSVLATSIEIKSQSEESSSVVIDTLVRIWNPYTEEEKAQWKIAGAWVTGLSVDQRGKLVAASIGESPRESIRMNPSRVIIWDARTGSVKYRLNGCQGLVPALCFRPDSHQLAAVGMESQMVYTWDLDATQSFQKRPALSTPTSVNYSPDGQRIAIGCYDNRVRIWDSRTPNEALSLLCLGMPGDGNYAFKSWVAFSPDGRRLAASNWHGSVTVWDAPFAE